MSMVDVGTLTNVDVETIDLEDDGLIEGLSAEELVTRFEEDVSELDIEVK